MKYIITLVLIVVSTLNTYSQDTTFLNRIRGLYNNNVFFFNVDGIDITSHHVIDKYSRATIESEAKKLKISPGELTTKDEEIPGNNYYVLKPEEVNPGIKASRSYYFIETSDKDLLVVTFTQTDNPDRKFERTFIKMILANIIPRQVIGSMIIDSVNFAGREIKLGKACTWKGVNDIEFNYAQMNWSVCNSLQVAQRNLDVFIAKNSQGKGIKVESEKDVDVIFEGKEIKAKNIIYKITGAKGLLTRMSGMKYLSVYYVVTELRGNYVFCVLSRWKNSLTETTDKSLPSLLSEVMTLN